MRTTVDIPDPIYRQLKSEAALEGRSVKDLILQRITKKVEQPEAQGVPGKLKFPAIESKNPGSLKLGPEGVYEYIDFPDVNVWLALGHKVHPQHRAAIAWGEAAKGSRFYFCRFSQLSMLRLLTNSAVMQADVVSQVEAWRIYDMFYDNGATFFADEPPRLELTLRKLTNKDLPSNREWADSYLSAFATLSGFSLVTFDRGLAKRTAGSTLLTAEDSIQ